MLFIRSWNKPPIVGRQCCSELSVSRLVILIFVFFTLIAGYSLKFKAGQALAAETPEVEWKKILEGSREDWDFFGYFAQQTADGGYVIVGTTGDYYRKESGGRCDICLIKTDASGKETWRKIFSRDLRDCAVGSCVQQTADGGYIILGHIFNALPSLLGPCFFLVKTDAFGNKLWEQVFEVEGDRSTPSARGTFVQQTADGGFIITGSRQYVWHTDRRSEWRADMFLLKTDACGNKLWEKTFGERGQWYSECVQETTDGGYIVSGSVRLDPADTNVFILKTDACGNKLWEKSFGGKGHDYGKLVLQTADNGYILVGSVETKDTTNLALIRTDTFGNKLWEKTFSGPMGAFSSGWFLQETNDGGYVLAGEVFNGGYVIKTDAFGNRLWEKTFEEGARAFCVQQTTDGGYIVLVGSIPSGTLDARIEKPRVCHLIKLKPEINSASNFKDAFKDMAGHWAEATVLKLAGMGVISGYPDGTFQPEKTITRAEIASILQRALKLALGDEAALAFVDKDEIPAWVRGPVAAVAREGLLKGYPVNGGVAFKAANPITRVELAAILSRVVEAKKVPLAGQTRVFADATTTPAWAKDPINTAAKAGIVSGYTDGTFRPDKPVTRAEAASMILRLLEKIPG